MKTFLKRLIPIRLFTLLLSLLVLTPAHANETTGENKNFSQTFGDYTVYYSIFNSTFIQPEVAKAANIVRGGDRAIVNISVRKKIAQGDEAATATVTGVSNDLMRDFPLEFSEVKEPGAIYYLAQFDHFNEETRRFTIKVKVADETSAFEIKFTQKLWHDEP